MDKQVAHGFRGDWFAQVGDEYLPCVHAHWWSGKSYSDPHARPGDPQFERLVRSIKELGRVILTTDITPDEGQSFQRTGYVAVFEVTSPILDQDGLRFTFTKRVYNLK